MKTVVDEINDNHFLIISNLLPKEKSDLVNKIEVKSRMQRKNIKKELHSQQGINIFPKKGLTVNHLLDFFKEQELIFENRKGEIHLTEEGEEKYELCMSDNMSKEFLSYYSNVKELFEKNHVPPIDFKILLKFYKNKVTIKQLENTLKLDVKQETIKKYYEKQVELLTNEKYDDSKFYFHFSPELFIKDVTKWSQGNVKLKIEGIPHDSRFVVDNPYPNKYYHVLRATENKNSMLGYYPMIGDKSIFERPLEVKLTWSTTNLEFGKEVKYEIEHVLKIQFSFEKFPKANFFFFDQSIRYGFFDFDKIKPTTCLLDQTFFNSALSKNRNVEKNEKDNRKIQLYEEVVLQAIPLGFQHSPNDVSFEKFSKQLLW